VSAVGFEVNDARLVFEPELHVYRLGDRVLPSVTQILAAAGISDFSAPWFTDAVKDRGTFIHAAIALDNEGDLDDETLDDALVPYVEGWRRYRLESECEIEHWEVPVCDPVLGYAGTLDGIVRTVDERGRETRTILDVKRALYPSAGPQVAAYRRCAAALYGRPVLFKRAVLELPGDGSYKLHPLTNEMDETVFLAALRVLHFRRMHGLDS